VNLAARQIGVISDTHGLLRPAALEALAGSELIIHAGDIGKPEVLTELGRIAPVVAVRGNNDRAQWAEPLPEKTVVSVGGVKIYLLHILPELTINPAEEGIRVVISGHSHKPLITYRQNVLYLNPGSAGPRRFKLPISVALLHLKGDEIEPQLLELPV
jgi:putative phosphoesterase